MLKITFIVVLIYLELEPLASQSDAETNVGVSQTSLFEITHSNLGENQTKSNENNLSYSTDTKSFDYTQQNSSEKPHSTSYEYTQITSSETPQSTSHDYAQLNSSETPQSLSYDYTQIISSETLQSTSYDYTPLTSSETIHSSSYDYTPLISSETPQSTSYDYTPLTLSETPQSTSYVYTPITASEVPLPSSYNYSPLTLSETPQSTSYVYTSLTASETPLPSSYNYSPLTSSETPQLSSYDYTQLTSSETPQPSSYDYTQLTSCESQQTSFYHIQSTLSEIKNMSELNSLSTLNEFQGKPTLISTTLITPNLYILSTLRETKTTSIRYTPSTQSQTHTTPYQPILSTVLFSASDNPTTSTQPATTHTSSPRGENIVLIAILSSVAAFLVISFTVLTCCLVYRRRKNARDAPEAELPGNISHHPRRHFHFSYLPNPRFRRSSTDSLQALQTSRKPAQAKTQSSVRSTTLLDTDYSTINGETAFNGNNKPSVTHQRNIKPKLNKFVLGRKVKNAIPPGERLSVVNEEVIDEGPVYAVVNKNRSPKMKQEHELSTSNTQNDKDILYGPGSTQAQGKDLDNPLNQTLRTVHTQVPYSEIVWHNSETDVTSTPNQVYSHLRDVERNFENPYN